MNTTTEQITVDEVETGDQISVAGGAPDSFFTVKSIRDGLKKGRGLRTTDGEYTSLPFGYPVHRIVKGA